MYQGVQSIGPKSRRGEWPAFRDTGNTYSSPFSTLSRRRCRSESGAYLGSVVAAERTLDTGKKKALIEKLLDAYNRSEIEVVTPSYRGPDRRDPNADENIVEPVSSVSFDAKGDPVWRMRADVPRRRKDDKPINLLDHLNLDSLSLQDEEPLRGEENTRPSEGYNPYNRNDE